MTDSRSKPPRLISVRTLRLENFTPGETPPYAILSHTWEGDEVLYAELESGSAWEKPQYDKIRNTAKQARQDGHDHIWIDCCCIDKHNAVELSEAINSMYAWYRNAEVCYALLSGVTRSDDTVWDEAHTSFIDCRYFTRGWTLQEMLASRKVNFFAEDWTPLGPLSDIAVLVSRASGVPQKVLNGKRTIFECSIAQRLSWAASRTTTKTEDMAYCLLGILDISLDLRYGESNQAFARLQEAILKKSSDLSVLAWTDADPAKAIKLLAHSPVNFRHCHDVVHYPTVEASSEHWTTDRGLKGTFPVRAVQSRRSDIGPEVLKLSLGCYHDSSPEGIIALTVVASGTTPSNNVLSVYLALNSDDSDFATPNNRLCCIDFLRYPENNHLNSTILWQGKRPVPNRDAVKERGDVKTHEVNIEDRFPPTIMWQRPRPALHRPSASYSVQKSSVPEAVSTYTNVVPDRKPQGNSSSSLSISGSRQAATKRFDESLDTLGTGSWQETWSKSQMVAKTDISRRSDRAPGSFKTAHEFENRRRASAKLGYHSVDARRNFTEREHSVSQNRPRSAQKQAARGESVDTPPVEPIPQFRIGNPVFAQLDGRGRIQFQLSASRFDPTLMQWTYQGTGSRMPSSLKGHWFSESTLSRSDQRFSKLGFRTGRPRDRDSDGTPDQSESDSSDNNSEMRDGDDEKSCKPMEPYHPPREQVQLPIMSRTRQTVRCPDCFGGFYDRDELSWHRASAHAADNSVPKARLLQRSPSPSRIAEGPTPAVWQELVQRDPLAADFEAAQRRQTVELIGPPQMQHYPRRSPGCNKLHRRGSLDNHPGWPGPQDPPTGTSKNGRRTKRQPNTNITRQVLTPPETQEESVADSGYLDLPATPTPADHLARGSLFPILPRFPTPASQALTLYTRIEDDPFTDDDEEDNRSRTLSPGQATPALSWPEVASPSQSSVMHDTPSQHSEPSIMSPQLLVPESPLLGFAAHHRATAGRNHPDIGIPFGRNNAEAHDGRLVTEVEYLRGRRRALTDELNASTAHVERLQARNHVTEVELMAERAVSAKARQDRETAHHASGAHNIAIRRQAILGRLQIIFVVLVLIVFVYGLWCWINQIEMRYIRSVAERKYRLSPTKTEEEWQ
ncbi:hypothetical protein LTR10_002278 [Elasticomyces elasticus]|nr:hypothetical protein LTR10_002278 [Elasticomyces elasticus]KAK4973650.1 hypothetical protein LTR42_005639 [Elasticomyces elasticus]